MKRHARDEPKQDTEENSLLDRRPPTSRHDPDLHQEAPVYLSCVPESGVKTFADLVHFVSQRLGIPDKVRDIMIQGRKDAYAPVPDYLVKSELRKLAEQLPCIAVTSKGYALYRAGPPQATGGITKDYIMKMGTYWWPITIGNGHKIDTLEDAGLMGQAMLTMLSRVNAMWAYDVLTNDIPSQDLMFGAALWAEYAFPVLQLGSHKYAAALMATSIPSDIEIKPPWPSFVIEMPSDLLHTRDPNGHDEPIEIIHVVTYGDKWSIYAHSRSMNLHLTRWLVEDMVEDREAQFITEGSVMDDRDNRTILLITRLVLSACLAASDPTNVKQVGKHAQASDTKSSARGAPAPQATRAFRVGKPIDLDVRPALQAFLSGERRSSPTVQWIVRGHWRNQAHGVGYADHRPKWIKPYRKGPEEAALNIRPHVIGKPKDS